MQFVETFPLNPVIKSPAGEVDTVTIHNRHQLIVREHVRENVSRGCRREKGRFSASKIKGIV